MSNTVNECTQRIDIVASENIGRSAKWRHMPPLWTGILIGAAGVLLVLLFMSAELNLLGNLILSARSSWLSLFVLVCVLIFIAVIVIAFLRILLQCCKEINAENSRIRENQRLIVEKVIECISSLDKTNVKCSPIIDISIRREGQAGLGDGVIAKTSVQFTNSGATSSSPC